MCAKHTSFVIVSFQLVSANQKVVILSKYGSSVVNNLHIRCSASGKGWKTCWEWSHNGLENGNIIASMHRILNRVDIDTSNDPLGEPNEMELSLQ